MATGVAQFHQPHNLLTRFRMVCEQELPELLARLLAAGCVWTDYMATPPPSISSGAPSAGDERLRMITGRRPVVEAVVAAFAEEEPGVTVRRGVKVGELLAGRSAIRAVPHVAGVRTAQGEELRADLVVDASGRRTRSAQWLEGLAARPPQLYAEDSGFAYYSRYFAGPTRPQRIGRAIAPLGTISIVTLDGDNDTWSVTIFGASGDAPLKALREPATFTRVVAACPLQAHWLDGEPITDVLAMAGILDCYRRFTIDGQPIVTGFAAVGDAWACTNPSAARGLSIGMLHAQHLRAVIRAHLDDPPALARAWDERTQQAVAPFVHDQIAADRVRIAEMDALRDGLPPPAPAQPMARFQAAAAVDLDVFRSLIETVGCTTLPREVLTRPAVQQAMERADPAPPPIPGPDRDTLLQLLAA